MKVTKEKAAENRARIVEAAARLFRERGFDGVGVAEITRAAGLTHGGFYGQFASKDALAAEACGASFAAAAERLEARAGAPEGDLGAYLDAYLSARHRDRRDAGCPMAAYATEIPRQDAEVQAAFADGLGRFADTMAAGLGGRKDDATDDRRRALLVLSAMVGGLVLARAAGRADPALSDEILAAVRAELTGLAA